MDCGFEFLWGVDDRNGNVRWEAGPAPSVVNKPALRKDSSAGHRPGCSVSGFWALVNYRRIASERFWPQQTVSHGDIYHVTMTDITCMFCFEGGLKELHKCFDVFFYLGHYHSYTKMKQHPKYFSPSSEKCEGDSWSCTCWRAELPWANISLCPGKSAVMLLIWPLSAGPFVWIPISLTRWSPESHAPPYSSDQVWPWDLWRGWPLTQAL